MNYLIIIILALISSSISNDDISLDIFESLMNKDPTIVFEIFHKLYDKSYKINSNDGQKHFRAFSDNLQKIKQHNSDLLQTYKKGINQFSDINDEEFSKRFTVTKNSYTQLKDQIYSLNGLYYIHEFISLENVPPMSSWPDIDYRQQCGKVFNQADCGCCYAFSMINTIECNYNIKKGSLVTLSRQQIVDCDQLDKGCEGGNAIYVAMYSKSMGNMVESDYPYQNKQNPSCKYDSFKSNIYLDGIEILADPFKYIKPNPYRTSWGIYNLLKKGALAVSIDGNAIKDYKTGVMNLSNSCRNDNHAVMIVGFGKDPIGGPYWIIKNQWDIAWGEKGYGRFKLVDKDSQDPIGNCFIYNEPLRPFID